MKLKNKRSKTIRSLINLRIKRQRSLPEATEIFCKISKTQSKLRTKALHNPTRACLTRRSATSMQTWLSSTAWNESKVLIYKVLLRNRKLKVIAMERTLRSNLSATLMKRLKPKCCNLTVGKSNKRRYSNLGIICLLLHPRHRQVFKRNKKSPSNRNSHSLRTHSGSFSSWTYLDIPKTTDPKTIKSWRNKRQMI